MNLPGLTERPVCIEVSGRTDVGRKRSENQDHFLVADLGTAPADGGVLLNSELSTPADAGGADITVGPKGALLLVADGMGGAAAGGLASKMAVAWIYEELASHWRADRNHTPQQFASRLRDAVTSANARIHEHAGTSADLKGMGSTATAAGVLDGFLYIAQVGDSRAYLIRRGEAAQLTRDQSLVQELVDAGELTEEEAGVSGQRNLILQALGTEAEVRVDLTYQQMRRGDVVVLCSDGLSGQVTRDEIARLAEGESDADRLCCALIALANERGGPDNITVIAARFSGAGLDDPADDDTAGRQPFDIADA